MAQLPDYKPLVFISYVHSEALDYATDAKIVFAECGFRTWAWQFDHAPVGRAKAEMVKNIEACDYFLDISTAGSRKSNGQEFERDEASKRNKPLIIFTFDKKYISEVWKGDDPLIYTEVTHQTFAPLCRKVAQYLLKKPARDRKEGEPLEQA